MEGFIFLYTVIMEEIKPQIYEIKVQNSGQIKQQQQR